MAEMTVSISQLSFTWKPKDCLICNVLWRCTSVNYNKDLIMVYNDLRVDLKETNIPFTV